MDDVPKTGGPTPLPEASPPNGGWSARLAWPLAVMVVALCGLMAFVLQQCNPVNQAGKLMSVGNDVAKGMEKLVAAIAEHRVTQSFVEHVDMVKPDMKNRLLVAERQTTEMFSTEDASWRGTATAELRVPVTYHYYVALTGNWDLRVQATSAGVVGEVIAPEMQALEPSINTSQLEMKSANGWANWSGSELKDNLLKDLTLRLDKRAATQLGQNFPAAHEAVEKFVRDWMLHEFNLAPGTPVYLRVKFRNEPGADLTPPPPKG
jgi:hypothetical protein